jgi:NAD(P)-dependent dehydrogenase (short-subunit alcohol dehydrogenase family)
MRLAGKVAIVTGAASGIGRQIALIFAREGAAVVVADRQVAPGQDTVHQVEATGGRATFFEADVSQAAAVERLVQFAVASYGKLTTLVNNAAASRVLPATELSEADWDFTINNTLKSVYLGAHFAIPAMLASGGGAIVNIASVNGLISNPSFSAYSAAKAGVLGLTRNLAIDYGRQGIRVNAICPGIIASHEERLRQDPAEAWAATETQVLDRYGRPEDVAWAAVFLASDEASFVTGSTLVVDGGLTIQSPEALVRPSFRRRWRPGRLVFQED